MKSLDNSPAIPQHPSWKICALVAALAVTLDVLLVHSPLVWLSVAGVVAVVAQFRSPLSGLAVVIFSCGLLNYSPFEVGALSRLYPGVLAIGIFLVAWLVSSLSWSRTSLFPSNPLNKPLLGIGVVASTSMFWSRLHPDPEVSYSYPHSDVSWATTQVSQLVLLAATLCIPIAVAAGIKRWKDVETVVMTVGIAVAIGTLITAGGLIFGFGSTYAILGATRSYWQQPWASSMEPLTALCLPFLFSGVLFGQRSLPRYWLFCLLFMLCLLGVVLTFSRESWLLALFGLCLVSASWLRSRVNSAFTVFTIALVLIAVLFSGMIGLISQFYDPDQVYGFERIYFYATALQLFVTHPLLGVGAGNYQFFDRSYEGESAGGIAHNQFLTTAAETGLMGLVMLLWLMFLLLRIRRQLRMESVDDSHDWIRVAGSAFLVVWMAECFFQEAFFATAAAGGGMQVMTAIVYPWIFLGVLLAVDKLSRGAMSVENY